VSGNLDEEFSHFVTARMGALRRVAYLLCQDWQRRTVLVREYLSEQRSGSPLVLEVMPFLEVGDEPRLYWLPSELLAGDRA
jgi:hypothetical protein